MEWHYENNEHEDSKIRPIYKLNRIEHADKIDLIFTEHSMKFDISTERELLMNSNISDKEKLKLLVDKCNESIQSKNWIWFIIGRVKRPDWHNPIPNLYQ